MEKDKSNCAVDDGDGDGDDDGDDDGDYDGDGELVFRGAPSPRARFCFSSAKC